MTPNPKIPLSKWSPPERQSIIINDYKYRVEDLIELVEDLKPFKLPLKGAYIDYESPCENSLRDFCSHVIATIEADLEYPIILGPSGVIMDGRHRLAKAVIEGHPYIMAVQLEEWPEGKYIDPKES